MKNAAILHSEHPLQTKLLTTKILFFLLVLLLAFGFRTFAQDPNLPPSGNFDLTDWKITLPTQNEIQEQQLSDGYESPAEFYTDPNTGAMVFRCRNDGATGGSTYPRSELREMLRAGNTSINTQGINGNNWVFGNSTQENQDAAGGVGGTLTATLAVDHVSTTGDSEKVGRVIVGQIHASDDEPCRIYYRLLPGHTKGSIYFAHEPTTSNEEWYEMIGSRSSSASEPEDGIELGEKFSYIIHVESTTMTVTIMRPGKPDVSEVVDMTDSGFADDYMYFKAGVYNQNNTGDDGDYCQASFYALSNSHSTSTNIAPTVSMTAPATEAVFDEGEEITITADAADSDGSISKVEFFHGTTLLGEDTEAPYSYTWADAPVTSYNISATATDNEGLSTAALGINISVKSTTTEYTAPYDIPRFQAFIGECKLQAPTSSTVASNSDLKNGYTDDNFYVVDGDKIAFNQTGSSMRTELRYEDNWNLTEENLSLHASIKVVEQTCDQVTILQIHDDANVGSGPNKPLLRIYKHLSKSPANHLWAAVKTDDGGVNTTHFDLGEAPVEYFDCDIRLVDGNMIIELDGVEKANMDVSFWTFPSYWKAGVYLQDAGEATAYFDKLFTGDGSVVTNSPPFVEISSPSDGETFVNGNDVTIEVEASDGDGTVTKVEFFQGSTKLGEDLEAPYSYQWSFVPTGDYTLTAIGTDNEGAMTTSSEVNIIVTATPTYTVSTIVYGNGKINVVPNPPSGLYEEGTEVYFTADPDPNEEFKNWSGDASGTDTRISIIIESDLSVTAIFTENGEEEILNIETPLKLEVSTYPNPFDSKVTMEYSLDEVAPVELTIFNLSGQRVATLVNETQSAGNQKVTWDAGNQLLAGLYLVKLKIGTEISISRIVLNR